MIQILFRCDDYGSGHAANRGILAAVAAGVARNVSVMANGPALLAGAQALSLVPNIDIGVHVCLNSEWDEVKWGPVLPAGEVPSLVDASGWLTQSPNVLHAKGFELDDIEKEVRAQIRKIREVGLTPNYLDEHMGVGWLPGVGDMLARIAKEEGLVYGPKLEWWSGTEAPVGDGPFISVTHPCEDDAELDNWRHEGISVGQVRRERVADLKYLTNPERSSELARFGLISATYREIAKV